LRERQILRRLAETVVDPHIGLIHSLEPVPIFPGSPPFFHFSGCLANLRACGWQGTQARMDAAGASREQAAFDAVFEALRFYSASFFARHELPLFCAADASCPVPNPENFALFLPDQYVHDDFEFVPFTADTPVRWVKALQGDGSRSCVPAAMVLHPYHVPRQDDEASIIPTHATGLECALSWSGAAVAAICSAVKTDALAIVWQARMALPQVRIETLSDVNYSLVEKFETSFGRVTAFNASLDIRIPIAITCLRSELPGAPALAFGAGADPNPEIAMRKALEDLSLAFRYGQEILAGCLRSQLSREIHYIVDPVGHLAYWCDVANTSKADFIFASNERVEFTSLPDLAPESDDDKAVLSSLNQVLKEARYDVYLADITPPDLEGLGVTALRAIIPGLQYLFTGQHRQALGGDRIRQVPGKIGYKSSVNYVDFVPHPFIERGAIF
jgi:ribosomal protein S12 methylthiotransferase accessory factor